MNVTIQLSDEQAEALRAQASARGLSVEDWLQQLAAQHTPRGTSIAHLQRTDPEEWGRQFEAWVQSHRTDTPLLSDEAVSRESIYPDRK